MIKIIDGIVHVKRLRRSGGAAAQPGMFAFDLEGLIPAGTRVLMVSESDVVLTNYVPRMVKRLFVVKRFSFGYFILKLFAKLRNWNKKVERLSNDPS